MNGLRGKLVRLDVALLAIHLMIARICFRSLPSSIRKGLHDTKEALAKLAGGFILGRFLKEAAAQWLKILTYLGNILEAEAKNREFEQSIRRNALRTQRECSLAFMGAGKPTHRKRTRAVWSRHQHAGQTPRR